MSTASQQKIGVATATIIGMNAMIGSGIFTAPAALAANVGPAGLVTYLFVTIAVWFIAQSLARVATLLPAEGSFYAYVRPWAGHAGGLYASASYLLGLIIAMAALGQVAGSYLHHFFPTLTPQILGALALGVLVLLNAFGVALSSVGQHVLIACTLLPLIVVTMVCFSQFTIANFAPFAPWGWLNVLKATKIAIFSYFGFECAASLFTIVERPEHNIPRALTYSITIVGILYLLFIASIIGAVPLTIFSNPETQVPDVLRILFPHMKWLLLIVYLSILSAITGTVHSMVWTAGHLLVSCLKVCKAHMLRKSAQFCARNHWCAVLLVGSSIFLSYFLIGNLDLFFSLVAILIVTSYMMAMITLLMRPQEWRSGQNVKTVVGMITAATMLGFALQGVYTAFLG